METKTLVVGLISLSLLLTGTVYFNSEDPVYTCQAREVASTCHKLSEPNNGLSTRCYYDRLQTTKYYSCTSGWETYQIPSQEPQNDVNPIGVIKYSCNQVECVVLNE